MRVHDGRRLNPLWWRVAPIADEDQVYRCDTCNRIEGVAFQHICPRRGCDGCLVPVVNKAMADNHYGTLYRGDLRGKLVVEEHTAQLTTERGREVQREFQEGRIHVLSCSTTFELGVDLGDLNTVFLRNVPPEPFNYAQRALAGRAVAPARPGLLLHIVAGDHTTFIISLTPCDFFRGVRNRRLSRSTTSVWRNATSQRSYCRSFFGTIKADSTKSRRWFKIGQHRAWRAR
jgi:hypothetical protein